MTKYDNRNNTFLVVGAGFSGAVAARILADRNMKVQVIDKRSHIAGNAYDYMNEIGHRVHKYGPHIFHTNNESVVNWLSKFTSWEPYHHKVKAKLPNGMLVTLPPNRETRKIVGEKNIIDTLFRPYTKKMWGLDIEEIDPAILSRVPIRNDHNELYFPNDEYQYMPTNGYTALIDNILKHENISVSLNTKFEKPMEISYSHVFNSMPIDEYYNYEFGKLPYRSIKFHTYKLPIKSYQNYPTENFTDDGPVTRVTEWKKYPLHDQGDPHRTTLTFEEPCCYTENDFERYYPVKDVSGENRKIYEKYKNKQNNKVTFIGRCGLYVYIDMHQAVNSTIAIVNSYLDKTV